MGAGFGVNPLDYGGGEIARAGTVREHVAPSSQESMLLQLH